jgi:hypothetical protein
VTAILKISFGRTQNIYASKEQRSEDLFIFKGKKELFLFSVFNFLALVRNVFGQDGKKPTQNSLNLNQQIFR